MDWWLYLVLLVAGFVTGFINTLAGSGSLITLPLLIFLGLDAHVANGTNRIGIFLQSLVGVANFKKNKALSLRDGLRLSAPALVGSLVGAKIAINLDEQLMEKTIGVVLVFMFFVILLKPAAWMKVNSQPGPIKMGVWQVLVFFAVGVYGGFIQAGTGFFILTGLVMSAGLDLIKANALKLFIIAFYTPIALGLFMYYGQVNYEMGLLLAVGSMLGAYVASNSALKWGTKFVRWVLLSVILLAGLKLAFF